MIWDGAPIHRSKLVMEFVASLGTRVHIERLPAYAPELNPTEYIWGYLKKYEIANLCPKNIAELGFYGRRALARMRRRPKLVTAFWKQAELFK